MILETVRIIADWLTDATHGVNAVRLAVPKATGVLDFPAVTVLDSTRNSAVARGGVPNLAANQFPALLVTPADQPGTMQRAGIKPGGYMTLTVLIRYATRELDTAKAERDASQTIKCVVRQLPLLFRVAGSEANRERADVQVHALEDLSIAALYESTDDTTVTGGVLVTCLVRNTALV